jgi:aconitate hydratase
VLARSFERIHRSNLVNMGVLPLRLPADRHPAQLRLRPGDRIEVDARAEDLTPRADIQVRIHRADGATEPFTAQAAVETNLEVRVLAAGGIIPMILQRALQDPEPHVAPASAA